jgi:hypothetical protein
MSTDTERIQELDIATKLQEGLGRDLNQLPFIRFQPTRPHLPTPRRH